MSSEKRRYELKARAEAQQATRARIAAAAASLHEEVGVAATTVADIARRAGVSRLTVYNHFPGLDALLPACSAHWLAEHPEPDLTAAWAAPDPLGAVLEALYAWYAENEAMLARLLGERASVPELDAWMARSTDTSLDELADGLTAALGRDERRPLVRLSLDFWTWRRLHGEGQGPEAAAALMASAVTGG